MTITRDYPGLVSAIGGWLHRSNLADQIPTFTMLAESRIYRKLRVRGMEATLDAVTSGGVIALPTRYVEMKHIRVDGQKPMSRKSATWIRESYPLGSGGSPLYFAREGESLIFGPAPADGTPLKGMYYQRPLPLADDNPSNWFTENAFDLLMFAALCEASPYMANDARIPVWESKFAALMADIQAEDDNESSSGPLTLSIG